MSWMLDHSTDAARRGRCFTRTQVLREPVIVSNDECKLREISGRTLREYDAFTAQKKRPNGKDRRIKTVVAKVAKTLRESRITRDSEFPFDSLPMLRGSVSWQDWLRQVPTVISAPLVIGRS